jgi:hypothetical protein
MHGILCDSGRRGAASIPENDKGITAKDRGQCTSHAKWDIEVWLDVSMVIRGHSVSLQSFM